MDDFISRQAAIEAFRKELCREREYAISFDGCERILSEQPSVQPEPKWIPVSERLPELDEVVLATTAWNDITIAWRIGISEWFIHEGNTNAETDDVVAWMPLPEPWKGEDDERA